ncbi:hypothetical protein Syn7502_01046 [Synechococcus sp. PCC 7502]|uniref:hypothetical protein n=1 Tax=Synechococcus sp. PCC 7502 TaxID=1173263 RepID=UPI00029FBCB7|nr:hypothetical protein [Synechococcus sp. PCC 7502]AFY73156.1 hypothetical protein Syn7502_01046 [Synechococcus sp. PCC 7502]
MQQDGSHIDQVNLNPLHEQAEELMDSLFSEVEQTLAIADTKLPSSTKTTTSKAKLESSIVKIRPETITRPAKPKPKLSSSISSPQPPATIFLESTPVAASSSVSFIDSLLLGSALTSAIFAILLGFINFKITTSSSQTSPQTSILSQTDNVSAPVAEKLRRSLLEIKPTNTSASPTSDTSAVNSPNSLAQPLVKPIYIPIYQPAPPSNPPTASSVTSTSPASIPGSRVASVVATPKKPAGSYTLIGVLDLGDRSSAIFDVNGSTQSFKLGSVVADSGWTLARITQQEVTLKRGSEDTKITVGQKF